MGTVYSQLKNCAENCPNQTQVTNIIQPANQLNGVWKSPLPAPSFRRRGRQSDSPRLVGADPALAPGFGTFYALVILGICTPGGQWGFEPDEIY